MGPVPLVIGLVAALSVGFTSIALVKTYYQGGGVKITVLRGSAW